jgi:hypothetical protein
MQDGWYIRQGGMDDKLKIIVWVEKEIDIATVNCNYVNVMRRRGFVYTPVHVFTDEEYATLIRLMHDTIAQDVNEDAERIEF